MPNRESHTSRRARYLQAYAMMRRHTVHLLRSEGHPDGRLYSTAVHRLYVKMDQLERRFNITWAERYAIFGGYTACLTG